MPRILLLIFITVLSRTASAQTQGIELSTIDRVQRSSIVRLEPATYQNAPVLALEAPLLGFSEEKKKRFREDVAKEICQSLRLFGAGNFAVRVVDPLKEPDLQNITALNKERHKLEAIPVSKISWYYYKTNLLVPVVVLHNRPFEIFTVLECQRY